MAFPAGAVPGIDVSHYQGTIDWATVATGGETFAFAKASEGISVADVYFADNWSGIKSAGILRGAYHFFHPSADAGTQATFFLRRLAAANGGSPVLAQGDLPPMIDLEVSDGVAATDVISGAGTWLSSVGAATGRTPILYTYPSFWRDTLANPIALATYPLWIAHLNVASPTIPGGWGTWLFWQFDKQPVDGVPGGVVDLDAFNGSATDLQSLAGFP